MPFCRRVRVAFAALCLLLTGAAAAGDLIVTAPVWSSALGNARSLRIWLPPGYAAEPTRRYPVLYVHDAQNVFEAATSFSGVSWGLAETATRLIAAGQIEPFIAVGIDHTGERMAEYSPCCDAKGPASRLDSYVDFLARVVKPMIDSTYRTRPAAVDTAVMGSSLGGLAAIAMAIDRPQSFGKVAALSTAFWWGDEVMVKRLAAVRRLPGVLYFDTADEHDTAEESGHAVAALIRRGWREGRDFTYYIDHGARHHESSWAARLDRPLRLLFPPPAAR